MKRILLAAGIGLSIFTVTMATTSNNQVRPVNFPQILNDTVPKDTTHPKPKPDSTQSRIFTAPQSK